MGPKKYFNQPGHSLFAASDPPDTVCRDAANHLSYGPEITGCKYNIKLNYLQTLYNSVTATRYLKVFHNHIYAMLYPAG